MTDADDATRRRRVTALQRWLVNPPMRILVWLALVPGHVIVETRGRRTGRHRRTVVGAHRDDGHLWVVAEQGRHAGWVRNLEAAPEIRVRHRGRWHHARGAVVDDDDPVERLASWGRRAHARAVQRFGTDLTTVRIDLTPGERDAPDGG